MLASPSSDETGAATAAKCANDRRLTILLTKLDGLVEQMREAVRGADRKGALTHVEQVRALLLMGCEDEAAGRATAWERVLRDDHE